MNLLIALVLIFLISFSIIFYANAIASLLREKVKCVGRIFPSWSLIVGCVCLFMLMMTGALYIFDNIGKKKVEYEQVSGRYYKKVETDKK